jgi:hypothetical protein
MGTSHEIIGPLELSQTRSVIGCLSVVGVIAGGIAGLLNETDRKGMVGIGEPLGDPLGKTGRGIGAGMLLPLPEDLSKTIVPWPNAALATTNPKNIVKNRPLIRPI